MGVDLRSLERLAKAQDGCLTRRQATEHGATSDWITRQVRRRRWRRLHPGVFATYTGPPRWRTRARAALLYAGRDSCISHTSAAYHHGLRERPGPEIHLSIPATRRVAPQPGLVIHRRPAPPPAWGNLRSTSPAATVVDLAEDASSTPDTVVSDVCAAAKVGVTGTQMLAELEHRSRPRRQRLLRDILAAVQEGVESALEYRYHRDVERRHGLPRSSLQVRQVLDGLWLRADCRYRKYRVRVELDGQLAHPGGRTDADVWRDNSVVLHARELTLRYRWRHVATAPCATARQVGQALRAAGWEGRPNRCGPRCTVLTAA